MYTTSTTKVTIAGSGLEGRKEGRRERRLTVDVKAPFKSQHQKFWTT